MSPNQAPPLPRPHQDPHASVSVSTVHPETLQLSTDSEALQIFLYEELGPGMGRGMRWGMSRASSNGFRAEMRVDPLGALVQGRPSPEPGARQGRERRTAASGSSLPAPVGE